MVEMRVDGAKHRSETDLSKEKFDNPDVSFHVETGRKNDDDENTISAMPCPDVNVYLEEGHYEAIVHLPSNIIVHWLIEEDDDEEFLPVLIRSLDEGYDGIKDIMNFEYSDEDVASEVKKAFRELVPYKI